MAFKILKIVLKVALILISLLIFAFYLNFLLKPFCLKMGYTLCAAIGEDFFALYQATYNFFHNHFIYGDLAKMYLVSPYFMIFKYFPASPLLIGWPFLIFASKALIAYHLYLIFVILVYIFAFYAIYLIAKKFRADSITKALLFFMWFTYFPLLADLRMGQFNLISSLFFLFSLVGIIYYKPLISGLMWIISLAYKPLALLNVFYYLKTKNKVAIISFVVVFVVFTGGYLLYHQIYYPQAINDFLKLLLLKENRIGWQVHYPDNFSVFSFLGELFYDRLAKLFKIVIKIYTLVLMGIFSFITYRIKFTNDIKTQLYYSLYAFSTLLIYHREVWESWLTAWLVIIVFLFILALSRKEKIFLFCNSLILGTPTLFYYYELTKSNNWRFLLIAEKVLPQILIYGYLVFLLFNIIKQQNIKKAQT